jgi:hypothetical protein
LVALPELDEGGVLDFGGCCAGDAMDVKNTNKALLTIILRTKPVTDPRAGLFIYLLFSIGAEIPLDISLTNGDEERANVSTPRFIFT